MGAPLAYFITWRTYASRLHGGSEPTVDRRHNAVDTPMVPRVPSIHAYERDLAPLPWILSDRERAVVDSTIRQVAVHRGWDLRALNVRTTHVHAVVTAEATPEKVMNDFKAWSTRRLRNAGIVQDEKIWARHGSTRWLWTEAHVHGAVRYTLEEQVKGPQSE
jgi:REP element-mobilizing transposase RayT